MKKLTTVLLMAVLALTVGFSQPEESTNNAGDTINGPSGGTIGGNRHGRI